eukprot:scaffold875_cov185-Amphora_coffeaeformis.AAC.6
MPNDKNNPQLQGLLFSCSTGDLNDIVDTLCSNPSTCGLNNMMTTKNPFDDDPDDEEEEEEEETAVKHTNDTTTPTVVTKAAQPAVGVVPTSLTPSPPKKKSKRKKSYRKKSSPDASSLATTSKLQEEGTKGIHDNERDANDVNTTKNDDDEEEEEEDLDAALANMDIEKDFSVFDHDDEEEEVDAEEEQFPTDERIEYWQERVARDEVYSQRYKPSREEVKELQTLQRQLLLGDNRSSSSGDGTTTMTTAGSALWNTLFGSNNNSNNTDNVENMELDDDSQHAAKVLFTTTTTTTTTAASDVSSSLLTNLGSTAPANATNNNSIILKRGTVDYYGGNKIETNGHDDDDDDDDTTTTTEVILLTHGMLLVEVVQQQQEKQQSNARGILPKLGGGRRRRRPASKTIWKRRLQQAILWPTIHYVGPAPSDPQTSWRIMLRQPKPEEPQTNDKEDNEEEKNTGKGDPPSSPLCLQFRSPNAAQQSAWLQAFERILVQHHVHQNTSSLALGWQYTVVHKPGFTLAVQGRDDGLPLSKQMLNEVDEYNEYTPLHYAVRLNQVVAARRLLEAGANVDAKDGDDHTAMYYALRDDASEEMTTLLETYGAPKKKKNKEWKVTEELFGRVKATDEKVAKKREQEQQEKAALAQEQMSENMRLLNERGTAFE